MMTTKTIEKNKVWHISCGDWTSKGYLIRIEAMNIKRILDAGSCSCDSHNIYWGMS